MNKRCIKCKKEAIIYIPYAHAAFCKEHFIEFYERRILRALKNSGFKGERILVGVSGGKDSMALLHVLHKLSDELNIEIATMHIDLGIWEYSKISKKLALGLSKKLGLKTYLIDVTKELGTTIPNAVKIIRKPACSICGIVKRYLLNKKAIEEGYDYVATGHNIDDISTYALKALFTQRVEDIIRIPEVLSPQAKDLNLAGRLRPQLFLSERENMLYCELNGIEYTREFCPLSKGAKTLQYKKLWDPILRQNPLAQINLLKSLYEFKKHMKIDKPKIVKCMLCGYPTASKDEICMFCKIKIKLKKKHENEP